jgi:hypothetical protein
MSGAVSGTSARGKDLHKYRVEAGSSLLVLLDNISFVKGKILARLSGFDPLKVLFASRSGLLDIPGIDCIEELGCNLAESLHVFEATLEELIGLTDVAHLELACLNIVAKNCRRIFSLRR